MKTEEILTQILSHTSKRRLNSLLMHSHTSDVRVYTLFLWSTHSTEWVYIFLPLTNVRLSYYPCTLSSPPYPCMNLFPIHDFACICIKYIIYVSLILDVSIWYLMHYNSYDIWVSNRVDNPIIVFFFISEEKGKHFICL